MDYDAFERAAHDAFASIPDAYREGVDGLVVSRQAMPHPEHAGVYTLGHCRTEDHASDYGSSETTRSVIALYWGSFSRLADMDPDFDWERELWDTLTHELRHHLESLAREDALEGVDHAMEETFKRDEGRDFDPWYYQRGERSGPSIYAVEDSYYIERLLTQAAFDATARIDFEWRDRAYSIPRPDALGDVHFVWLRDFYEGVASVELVLVRHRSWWEDVKRLGTGTRPRVLESEATAE